MQYKSIRKKSPWILVVEDFKENYLALISLYLIFLLTIISIFLFLFLDKNIASTDILVPPDIFSTKVSHHFLGTDPFGDDLFFKSLKALNCNYLLPLIISFITIILNIIFIYCASYLPSFIKKIILEINSYLLLIPSLVLAAIILMLYETNSPLVISFTLLFVSFLNISKCFLKRLISIESEEYYKFSKQNLNNYHKLFFLETIYSYKDLIVIGFFRALFSNVLNISILGFLSLGGNKVELGFMVYTALNFLDNHPWLALIPALVLFFILFLLQNIIEGLNKSFNLIYKKIEHGYFRY